MHTKSIVSLAALAVVAGSAFAADPSAPLMREQVRQSVIAARAAGQLQSAGPAYDGPAPYDNEAAHSQFTRAEVRHEVAVARANGQLAPAGEAGDDVFSLPPLATSTVSRATVKAETLQARANGELIPAGEDVDGAARTPTVRTASATKPSLLSSLFKTSGTATK
jgi:cytochrome c556